MFASKGLMRLNVVNGRNSWARPHSTYRYRVEKQ